MSEFDSSKITVSDLKTLDSGAKLGFVNYAPRNRCGLETPEVYIPFECRKFNAEDGGAGGGGGGKLSITLSLKKKGEDPDMDRLIDTIEAVDNRVIDIGVENALKWGLVKPGKPVNRDLVDNAYTPSIKYSLNKDTGEPLGFPPQLRVKFPEDKSGQILTEVYDQTGKRVYFKDPAEVFRKGSKVRCIIECTGLWCSQKFGLTWKLMKAVVQDASTGSPHIEFSNFKTGAVVGSGGGGGGGGGGDAGGNEYDDYERGMSGSGSGAGGGESVVSAMMSAVSAPAPAPAPAHVSDDDDEDEDGDDMPKAPLPTRGVPTRPGVGAGGASAPAFGRKRKPVGVAK
jgi:hypothetical protein